MMGAGWAAFHCHVHGRLRERGVPGRHRPLPSAGGRGRWKQSAQPRKPWRTQIQVSTLERASQGPTPPCWGRTPRRTEQVSRATAPGQNPCVVPDPPVGTTTTPNRSALCVARLLIPPRARNAGRERSSLYLLLQHRPALTHAAVTSHLRPPSTWPRARMGRDELHV